ncbi:unnamed protein product, partial [marine sediment metagenome]
MNFTVLSYFKLKYNFRKRNNMNDLEKWEFGSLEWCKFAAETGVKLINQANLDLSKYEWGFSEVKGELKALQSVGILDEPFYRN